MVQHTMSYIADMEKLEVIDVVIDIPTDEATVGIDHCWLPNYKILKEVEAAFAKYGHNSIALAVFDHIVSMPAAVLPVKELIEIARS